MKYFSFHLRDLLTTAAILGLASLVCAGLKPISDADFHVPLIFVLAVLLVSLSTDGYLFGAIASVVGILGVNIVFTYPYFQLNFSRTGYPLTFLCMFAVSMITCTLTTRVRKGEQLRLEAEREKLRANLLRAISHDLRTPLTSMIGSTNAVLENGDRLTEAEKRALLTDARNEAEWLYNMVENLLSVTRIGTVLRTEPQMVEEVLGEASARFGKQFPSFRVEMEIPEEPLFVDMDAMLIEQVLLNLLMNAATHGKTATGVTLRVTPCRNRVVFRAEDDGAGIRTDLLPHLFDGTIGTRGVSDGSAASASDGTAASASGREKLARTGREGEESPAESVEPSEGTAFHGEQQSWNGSRCVGRRHMGIGLSVCEAIVKAHGGTMEAGNRPQGGAWVSFWLPWQEPSDSTGKE